MKYKRILLKLSGDALSNTDNCELSTSLVKKIADELKQLVDSEVQVVIVVGGGNITRGATAYKNNELIRTNADYRGMLATIINGIALQDLFNFYGLKTHVFSSIKMDRVCDYYTIRQAKLYLSKGYVVICAGGTGSPYFTTDTNASLRAFELECDCILKATKVDGVYDSDPEENPEAKKYDVVTYNKVIENNLKVMDLTAISMCQDNKIPICVFNMDTPGNILKVCRGQNIGTSVVGD